MQFDNTFLYNHFFFGLKKHIVIEFYVNTHHTQYFFNIFFSIVYIKCDILSVMAGCAIIGISFKLIYCAIIYLIYFYLFGRYIFNFQSVIKYSFLDKS